MTTAFIKLLNMSITASWLILVVILLRIILKNAPKWIRSILWGLVAVRLICPISIESIFSLLPSAETIPQDIMYAEKPTIHTGVMAVNSVVNPYLSESMAPRVENSINPMQVVMNVGTVIWVAGMMGMLIYAFISYMRIKRKADVSLPAKENIYFCDYIDTPFVLGILRPRIYLPSSLVEDDKAGFVIAHEKAHIRRRDHWWKPLGFLLLTIYWFNPLIWVAYILLCRDIELACDEYVIGSLKEKEKKSYSDALLSCSMRSAGFQRNMISACPLAFGEVGVKDRVKAVLHYKRPAFWLVILGLLACIIAAICFLTDPKDNTSNARSPFGHSYRVEEVVYGDGRFSFGYTADTAPRYQFTSDYAMFVSSDVLEGSKGEEWVQQFGKFEEVKLSPLIFDDYFKSEIDVSLGMIGPDTIRVNTEKAWKMNVQDDENGVFYYFIQTKQGDVYLTYGYDVGDSYAASEDGSLIRWVFKLARTDIFSCNAVSEDCNAYVQPVYYPEGFDWDYEKLPQGYINEKGVMVFTTDWDTDSLVVSEDYYNNFNSGNRSGSTHIEKETYTLERNKAGQFELNVELRSANGDMAVYFVQAPEGVYVMKIIFAEDEASLVVSSKQYQPEEFLGMSYGDFQKLTETAVEFYHANFYTANIPNTEITAIFLAEGWDESNAIAVLQEEDKVIRLEGKLSALIDEFSKEMSISEFMEDSKWSDRFLAYTIEKGAGTSYYVGDQYVAISCDMNGDSMADQMLQVALSQEENISSDSLFWLGLVPYENEIIVYNGKEYKKSELCNATLHWLELSEHERIVSSYMPPEFMIFEENWGVTLTIDNITSTSASIVCTQSGGAPTGELQTGSWYIIENWTQENGWKEVERVLQGDLAWTMEAWGIQKNSKSEWTVNWEWLYGELPPGKYRIGKEITDFRKSGDYDNSIYFADFVIDANENNTNLN